MKTLKYLFIAVISTSIGLTSCHDDLNVIQPSQFTSLSMWKEESDATSAVDGAYSQFRSAFSNLLNIYGEMRSNLYESGSVGNEFYNRIGTNVILSSDTGTDWSNIYTVINSVNLILKHTPKIQSIEERSRNEIMANAYFLRAYCYFTLARVFGDCPLLTSGFESDDQENLYPYRTEVKKIYETVEDDINQAFRLMPSDSKSLHKASPSAIDMLRTEFYLWKAKRLNGDKTDLLAAQESIDRVLSSEYQLVEEFAELFNIQNENNSEYIWSLPYIINENVTPGNSPNFYANYLAYNSDRSRLRQMGYSEDDVPAGSHAQYVVPTAEYCKFLASDSNDTRTDVSVRVFTDDFLVKELLLERMIIKFKGSFENETRSFDSDVPIYRLAEAYLLKAEVENALGNTDIALRNLNIITKRAYGIDNYYKLNDQEEINKAIINESLKEFVSEGKAWWVYLRFNKEFEYIETLKGRENEINVTLWPVSPNCLNTNPNITQTEGFK